ncbi:hypothetical protein TgHK011_005893 [Trichoderma gracile]|nr:hypothetical protein TgHK011_005893 [Trichoderma gracile]
MVETPSVLWFILPDTYLTIFSKETTKGFKRRDFKSPLGGRQALAADTKSSDKTYHHVRFSWPGLQDQS